MTHTIAPTTPSPAASPGGSVGGVTYVAYDGGIVSEQPLSRLLDRVEGAIALLETIAPCGARTTSVECHLPFGHPGMHTGVLDFGGRYADMAWSDDWHAEIDGPWLAQASLEKEMPMRAVQVFSRGENLADIGRWVNT